MVSSFREASVLLYGDNTHSNWTADSPAVRLFLAQMKQARLLNACLYAWFSSRM